MRRHDKDAELNAREVVFVERYCVTLEGKQAAIDAGYSPKSARFQASQLLARPRVAAAVRARLAKKEQESAVDSAWVLARLTEIVNRCMQRVRPATGPFGVPLETENRDGEKVPAYVFDARGAAAALELIGKHFAMFTDKLQVDDLTRLSDDELEQRFRALQARLAAAATPRH